MRRRFSLRALVGAAAAGVLLVVGASPAASAGFAPNPGFEDDCAGIPCAWTNPPANATVSRDTAVKHEDDASLRLQITDPAAGESSVFTCIGGIGPGSYLASYWYPLDDRHLRQRDRHLPRLERLQRLGPAPGRLRGRPGR